MAPGRLAIGKGGQINAGIMFEWYKRWRHSRGYGVHSPSAYRLVMEVIRPSTLYAYYAYPLLHSLAGGEYSARELKLLYRVLVDFHPTTVCINGSDTLKSVVQLALPEAEICAAGVGKADFAVVGRDCEECPVPPCGCEAAFFFGRRHKALDMMTEGMRRGHIFLGKRHALIVNRADLPFQTFTLNF